MKNFEPLHVERSYSQELDASPEEVFPLLCPVREYEWIEDWECELVYSVSGLAELDCVFTTNLPVRGKETWLVCRYEPCRCIEFVQSGQGRIIRFSIVLEDLGKDRSRITWTHIHTAFNEEGNEYISTVTKENHASRMREMSMQLNHFLVTGTMIT